MDTLTKVNACGARLTSSMVMAALVAAARDGEEPTYARVHEAQRVSWLTYTVECHVVLLNPTELPDIEALPKTQFTIGGLPIVVDNKLWPSTLVFHNAEGKAVAMQTRNIINANGAVITRAIVLAALAKSNLHWEMHMPKCTLGMPSVHRTAYCSRNRSD